MTAKLSINKNSKFWMVRASFNRFFITIFWRSTFVIIINFERIKINQYYSTLLSYQGLKEKKSSRILSVFFFCFFSSYICFRGEGWLTSIFLVLLLLSSTLPVIFPLSKNFFSDIYGRNNLSPLFTLPGVLNFKGCSISPETVLNLFTTTLLVATVYVCSIGVFLCLNFS